MGYPPEWERVEPGGQAQGFVGFRPIEGSAVFAVGAKNVDIPPEFWDNKDSLGITLSEGKKALIEQLSNETGFKLLESNMTTLDGNPASKIVYLLKPDTESGIEEKYTELVSFKNNVQHRIIFVADVNEYNNYAPIPINV